MRYNSDRDHTDRWVTSEDSRGLLERNWDRREWQAVYERINSGIATLEEEQMMEDPYENVCGLVMDEEDEIEETYRYQWTKNIRQGRHITGRAVQLKSLTIDKMVYAFMGETVLESPEPKKRDKPDSPCTAVSRIFMQGDTAVPSVYTAGEETRIKVPKHGLPSTKD